MDIFCLYQQQNINYNKINYNKLNHQTKKQNNNYWLLITKENNKNPIAFKIS